MTCTLNELAGFLQNARASVISVAHIISDNYTVDQSESVNNQETHCSVG